MTTEFRTLPDPTQPGRCPSIDPHDTLQCGRSIHTDEFCQFGGISWTKGTPRIVSPYEALAIAEKEIAKLKKWKASATHVLNAWDLVWEALGEPGGLGQRKPDACLEVIKIRQSGGAV